MPTYSATCSTASYPYVGTYWTTSTTTDCSGYTWSSYKKDEIDAIKRWIESLKEPEITEKDILDIIEGDT